MKVLTINEDDIEKLFQISQERIKNAPLHKEDFLTYFQDKNMKIVKLLSDQNDILGYAIIRYEMDDAEIDEIAIIEKETNKGYGSFLLEQILNSLKKEGRKTVYLEVRKSNYKAIGLYNKFQFHEYRIRKAYYGNEDAICYRKEL